MHQSVVEVEADVLPHCRARNIGVIAYSPMASGLLTGGWTRERIATLPADDDPAGVVPRHQPGGGLALVDVAAREHDLRAARAEDPGGLEPEPAVRPRDHEPPTILGRHGGPRTHG